MCSSLAVFGALYLGASFLAVANLRVGNLSKVTQQPSGRARNYNL